MSKTITLDKLVRRRPLGVVDACELASDLLTALDDLHRAGQVHGNIHQANILVGGDRRAVLLDIGTPRPTGSDPRVDLYAVAQVLTFALTAQEKPDFRSFPHVPPAVVTILERAFSSELAKRYQLALEMRTDLQQACGNVETLPIEVVTAAELARLAPLLPPPPPPKKPAPMRRAVGRFGRPVAAALLAAAAAVAGFVAVDATSESQAAAIPPPVPHAQIAEAPAPVAQPAKPAAPVAAKPAAPAPVAVAVKQPPRTKVSALILAPALAGAGGVKVAAQLPTEEISEQPAAPVIAAAPVVVAKPAPVVVAKPAPAATKPAHVAVAKPAHVAVAKPAARPVTRIADAAPHASVEVVADTDPVLAAARANDRNGATELAIAGYRRYLRQDATAPSAAWVRRRLATLEGQ